MDQVKKECRRRIKKTEIAMEFLSFGADPLYLRKRASFGTGRQSCGPGQDQPYPPMPFMREIGGPFLVTLGLGHLGPLQLGLWLPPVPGSRTPGSQDPPAPAMKLIMDQSKTNER